MNISTNQNLLNHLCIVDMLFTNSVYIYEKEAAYKN